MSDVLLALWREWHPGTPEQLQLPFPPAASPMDEERAEVSALPAGELIGLEGSAAGTPPAWSPVIRLAIDAVSSVHTKRAYTQALEDFTAWYRAEPRPPLSRATVQQYRSHLEAQGLAPSPIVVTLYARQIGIPDLAPHDLRRTCAKLCRASGGDLEQIQFLLGHSSIQTTERYLGSKQNLRETVNDKLGIEEG